MHCEATERHDVGQRRQAMDHPELLVHGRQRRARLCHLRVLRKPDLAADAKVLLDLVPPHHHLQKEGPSQNCILIGTTKEHPEVKQCWGYRMFVFSNQHSVQLVKSITEDKC